MSEGSSDQLRATTAQQEYGTHILKPHAENDVIHADIQYGSTGMR